MTNSDRQDLPKRRPGLLVRAAQAAMAGYTPARDLPRDMRGLDRQARLAALLAAEARADADRRAGATGYSVRRHLHLLAVLLAEWHRASPDRA